MVVGSVIELRDEELTPRQWRKLLAQLAFVDANGEEVYAFDQRGTTTRMPRGVLDMIPEVEEVVNRRVRPKLPVLEHVKELDSGGFTDQRAALAAMYEYGYGQVRLSTGSGKTTIGCAFIAGCGTRSLVLVHTKDLLVQWVERAKEEIPGINVGVIQGTNFEVGHLTVATVQTFQKALQRDKKLARRFGCVIHDESQHGAAMRSEMVLNQLPAHYRFGLSASDKRSDGRQRLVRFNVGPVIYRAAFKSQVEIEVQPIFTNFRSRYNATNWSPLVRELVEDEARNKLIAEVVERETLAGFSVAVFSRQIKHLHLIVEQFSEEMKGRHATITGHLVGRKRKQMLDSMRDGSLRCILATQLMEEGVDIPRLDRIVLAFPGTDVTVLQKVGRVSRRFEGKEMSLVYDFADPHVAVLARQYLQRKSWYKRSRLHIRKVQDERKVRHAEKDSKARSTRGVGGWRPRRPRSS